MYDTGKLDILIHQTGKKMKGGYRIMTSGMQDGKHYEGVSLVLGPVVDRALLGYSCMNSKLMSAHFKTAVGKATIIQGYAPTSVFTEEG